MLSNAFMKPKASILISSVTFGDDLWQNLYATLLLLCLCACMCAVGSDVLASCVAAFLHLSMAAYVVSSLLRPDGTARRLPAKLLLTNFQTSSMAMRCSSLSRRMASCTFAMFRRTDVQALSSSRNVRAMHDHVGLGLGLGHMAYSHS